MLKYFRKIKKNEEAIVELQRQVNNLKATFKYKIGDKVLFRVSEMTFQTRKGVVVLTRRDESGNPIYVVREKGCVSSFIVCPRTIHDIRSVYSLSIEKHNKPKKQTIKKSKRIEMLNDEVRRKSEEILERKHIQEKQECIIKELEAKLEATEKLMSKLRE